MAIFKHCIGKMVTNRIPIKACIDFATSRSTEKMREKSSSIAALVVNTAGIYDMLPM